MGDGKAYVIITPVRDEKEYIEQTFRSVVGQTILPAQWIIADDGSTDGTGELLDSWAAQVNWIKVVHRKDRGFRAAGGGVVDAFYDGYSAISVSSWDFIVKLDGDLSFEPEYFENCLTYFECEPGLGIGGGTVCVLHKGELIIDSAGDPPFHVRGATKIYRRQCWDEIGPLFRAPGWDTIDEVKANYCGWTTRTFADPRLIQHKATGASDGNWRNWFKNGRANYVTGYHPIFMLVKCLKRAFRNPFFVGSVALWAGFCSGYIKAIPRLQDAEAIRYLRMQQVRRMLMRPSIYTAK